MMTVEEQVTKIVDFYKEVQPGPASLRNDGVTNAEMLRSILLPLVKADPSVINKLKITNNSKGDEIATHLHNEGKILMRVSLDETFMIGHMVCLTEAGKAFVEESRREDKG